MTTRDGRRGVALPAVLAAALFVILLVLLQESEPDSAGPAFLDEVGAAAAVPPQFVGGPVAPTAESEPERPAEGFSIPDAVLGVPGWDRLPAGSLAARTAHVAVEVDGTVLVWGGVAPGLGHNDGAVLDPRTGTWRSLPPAPVAGSAAHAWTGERLFLFTGSSAMWDAASERWRPLAYPTPQASHPLAAAWTGTETIVVGYRLHPPEFSDNLFATGYGPSGECCRVLPDPPIDLTTGTALWTGAEVLLLGGFTDGSTAMASYSPADNAWTVLEPPPVSGGGPLSAVWTGQRLVVIGADLITASWRPGEQWTESGFAPFDNAGCLPRSTVTPEGVFVWYCRQTALLDPVTGQWERLRTPRLDDHAVSTSCTPVAVEASVIMWCGNGDGKLPFAWSIELAEVPRLAIAPNAPGVWKTGRSVRASIHVPLGVS